MLTGTGVVLLAWRLSAVKLMMAGTMLGVLRSRLLGSVVPILPWDVLRLLRYPGGGNTTLSLAQRRLKRHGSFGYSCSCWSWSSGL